MKKVKSIRFPEWLEVILEEISEKEDRSFSNECIRRLKESLRKDGYAVQ